MRRFAMRRPVKWLVWLVGLIVGLILLLSLVAVLIVPSRWFEEKVRARMVTEIERVTGGKTEIGVFHFDWRTLTAEVAPFVLRGKEPASEHPLFRTESLRVGLKIVSMLKKDIDIDWVTVEKPQVNILMDENGKLNLPEPEVKGTGPGPVDRLVRLAIGRIDLKDGWVRYDDAEIPLTVQAENLQAQLNYDRRDPSYRGNLSASNLLVESNKTRPMAFDLQTEVSLYGNYLRIESARASIGKSVVEASGTIEDFKTPRLQFDVKANAALADIGPGIRLPQPHSGAARFNGKLTWNKTDRLLITGRAEGSGMAYRDGRILVNDIAVSSDVRFTLPKLELRGTRVRALGGTFQGMLDLVDYKQFRINGKVDGLSLAALSRATGVTETPYAASVAGPLEMRGTIGARDFQAAGKFDLSSAEGGVPVSGMTALRYDQRGNTVQIDASHVVLPSSRLDVSGRLGDALRVRLESRDLKDLLPAIDIAGEAPETLPITLLPGGLALFDGTVTGPMDGARIDGVVTLSQFEALKQKIDRLVANLNATSSGAHVASFAMGQETLRLEGSGDVGLQGWKLTDASSVKADVRLTGAHLEKLLAAAGQKIPVEGSLTASASVEGTVGDPRLLLKANLAQPVAYGEKFDRVRAEIRYAGTGVEVISGVAELGTAQLLLTGAFEHPAADYKNGKLRFDISTQNLSLDQVANVQKLRPGVRGILQVKAAGTTTVRDGALQPDRLDGLFALRDLVVDGRELGNFTVDAKTAGKQLNFGVAGDLRGSKITGRGGFELAGDYSGSGSVDFSRMTISTLHDFAPLVKTTQPLPFDGALEGRLTFSGPLLKPEALQGRLELTTLRILAARQTLSQTQQLDVSLRNAEPVVVEYDGKAFHIKSAHLVGSDTDIQASGDLNIRDKSPWDLTVDGKLNLAVLQNFNADIVSSGAATLNTTIRGTLQDPQVVGKMELKAASFYLADLPNGLDNANGTVLFDRKRATIEKLTAETGGGTIALTGFVGFGAPELTYRVQGHIESVRVRYPEGVSTTLSSTLSLSGSTSKSLLSGLVTIRRAGFNPKTDVGGILAASARPVATPMTPNPILRGMQLDIRIESAPNLQFQTALTSDLQAEADLRVRGTAAKPALLGRVSVNQGDVQFFGTKYTINRGEIGFYNASKIEPVLDMDLETRVRGVLVTINFTGTLSKLNVSYRSDPPLQSNEIIALLAVGRAPGTNSTMASGQTVSSQNAFSSSTNSLLGQAVAAPINGRLQRFFGVSRLKIDPQLTGINAVPQARLTIEQQISRDITLTYITNLAQANAQIVRLEWDMNKNWSVVALREDNGSFGVDFFFKRRF